jgi:hypothetical protein
LVSDKLSTATCGIYKLCMISIGRGSLVLSYAAHEVLLLYYDSMATVDGRRIDDLLLMACTLDVFTVEHQQAMVSLLARPSFLSVEVGFDGA